MDKPDPDPNAPVCTVCATNGQRRSVRETMRTALAVMVGEGTLYDDDGRKHDHFGTPGGTKTYECLCGNTWSQDYGTNLFPCWCGWGTN